MWEIALLRELGFRLELDKCAAGGDAAKLTHVSPKSGRAVSEEKATPYKEKLLLLPNFLRPDPVRGPDAGSPPDIVTGLNMTEYFLTHWAFAHHTQGVPEARTLFGQRYEKRMCALASA
jgi:DNA repair protein RecO (recombination protein O)